MFDYQYKDGIDPSDFFDPYGVLLKQYAFALDRIMNPDKRKNWNPPTTKKGDPQGQ